MLNIGLVSSLLLVYKVAKVTAISPLLLIAICNVETNFKNVVNPHDGGSPSFGICQVKEATARMVYSKHTTINHLMKPEINLTIAAYYIKYQLDRYDGNLDCAIAAYNAGSCNFNKKGLIKNRKYVAKVRAIMEDYYVYASIAEQADFDRCKDIRSSERRCDAIVP